MEKVCRPPDIQKASRLTGPLNSNLEVSDGDCLQNVIYRLQKDVRSVVVNDEVIVSYMEKGCLLSIVQEKTKNFGFESPQEGWSTFKKLDVSNNPTLSLREAFQPQHFLLFENAVRAISCDFRHPSHIFRMGETMEKLLDVNRRIFTM